MDSTESLNMRVAEEIRAMMARRRVTGRELARRVNQAQPWVSGRLAGSIEIGLTDLERIAAALEVEVADLLPELARAKSGERLRGTLPHAPGQVPAADDRPRSWHLFSDGHHIARVPAPTPDGPPDLAPSAPPASTTGPSVNAVAEVHQGPATIRSRRAIRTCRGTSR